MTKHKPPSRQERLKEKIDGMTITGDGKRAAGWVPVDVEEGAALDVIEARAGVIKDPETIGDAHLEFAAEVERAEAAIASASRAVKLPPVMMEHINKLATRATGLELLEQIIDYIHNNRTPQLRGYDLSRTQRVVGLLKRSRPALPDAIIEMLKAVKRAPGRPKKL